MPLRILIAVTHLLGAGHLTRAAAIGRALADAGHAVTLVSGGRPVPLIRTAGLDVVQLPPVRAAAHDLRTLLDEDGEPAGPAHLAIRREMLALTLRKARPDVVVVELFPFGRRSLHDEFTALLESALAQRPRPVVACSIRDILAAPSSAAKAERTHAVIKDAFDAVLVHADPRVIRLDESWPVDDALRSFLHYTGFVDGEPDPPPSLEPQAGSVVVSGGSSEAGLPLYRAAIDAATLGPDRDWLILAGHGVPERDVALLRATAPPNASVERASPEFRRLLAGVGAFVGQSGYNTCMDVLASRVRAVLVPFEGNGETEQRMRAERLAAAGLAIILPEAELSAAALLAAVEGALVAPPPPASRIDRGGLAETVRILEKLAASRAAAG